MKILTIQFRCEDPEYVERLVKMALNPNGGYEGDAARETLSQLAPDVRVQVEEE